MSIPVALDELAAKAAEHGPSAYLLTVADDGRPHAVAVGLTWVDGCFRAEAGRRTSAHVATRPGVTLLWPPTESGGYSLIVDGEASLRQTGNGALVDVRPLSAVLHRPAPAGPPGGSGAVAGAADGCGADCIPLLGPKVAGRPV